MKAVAVLPGKPNSVHLRDIPVPKLTDQPHPHVCSIPEGRAVLVKVLQVGVDATDREINEALYGNAPPGGEHLVIGHESFGQVLEVGDKVTEVKPGDYVSCTVRRPGGSLFDVIGRNDITSEEVYYERGINLCHGYLTEFFVDDAEYIVKVPQNLKHLGVLSEPASVCAKAIEQAFLAQQRLQVWNPKRAFVLGAGQIGLLATMMLKLRGLEVYTLATKPGPHRKSEIVEAYGATYVSTKQTSLADLAKKVGQARPDLRGDRQRRGLLPGDGSARPQRGPDLDEHHRRQARGHRRRRQDQPRMGARATSCWSRASTATAGTSSWASRPSRTASTPIPGVTERILTHPVDGPRQLQGNDGAARRQGGPEGLRQRRLSGTSGGRAGRKSTEPMRD